jgi:hypothetical protein
MTVSEESIKDATKAIDKIADKIDMKGVFSVFTSLLRAYGIFSKALGTIEQTDASSYEALMYLGQNAPQIMSILAKKSPPEEFGTFMQLTLKLIEITPKMEKISTLSAEEKIQLGTELESIANEYDALLKKLEEKVVKEKNEK